MKSMLFLIFVIASCSCAVEFSSRARNFSMKLLYYTQKETNAHVVVSPFGIWSLMISIALGAAGNSKAQLSKALYLPNYRNNKFTINGYQNLTKIVTDPATESVSFICKNFAFVDLGLTINSPYAKIMSDFGATVRNINFKDPDSAAKNANDLIKDSGASISNVLRSEDFIVSRMILTDVVMFKGFWSSPFNSSETMVENFYDENGNILGEVNMMHQRAQLPFSNMQSLKSVILELPYGNDNKYSMIVMLPYSKIQVTDVYEKLQTVSFVQILDQLQSDVNELGLEDIDIKLPRFKQTTDIHLNKPLKNMGVFDIFEPNLANLKHITKENIFVSSIIHKAYIEVTESGTVAIADTSAYFSNRQSTPNFDANRPFIYFVIEKVSATILFGGIYSEPSLF